MMSGSKVEKSKAENVVSLCRWDELGGGREMLRMTLGHLTLVFSQMEKNSVEDRLQKGSLSPSTQETAAGGSL